MKLTNAIIIFVVIFLAMFSIVSVQADELCELTKENQHINEVLDEAAFDVAMCMVEYDAANNLSINKEEAISAFMQAVEVGLNDPGKSKNFSLYVPCIVITLEDGFYINYLETLPLKNGKEDLRYWSDKIPYATACDDGYIYQFCLGEKKDMVTLIDTYTMHSFTGTRSEVRENTVAQYLDEDSFEELRLNTINNVLVKYIEYYINCHNSIARQYGINYNFYLPVMDSEFWIRSIDDISFLYIFQGYPYKSQNNGYYNRLAFAGARVEKRENYFIDAGTNTYHRMDCKALSNTTLGYATREECALKGAFPCEQCKP